MEKFLLKDYPIHIDFLRRARSNGGYYHRSGAASASALEVFKPRHGQEYAEVMIPLNLQQFQQLLPAANPSTGQNSEYIFIYFLCPMWEDEWEYDAKINKIRLIGSPLDHLLALNKDLQLTVNLDFDQNFLAKEMIAKYDTRGSCYFESTILPDHYSAFLSKYNGTLGQISIELVGVDFRTGAALPGDLQSTIKKLLEEQRFTDFTLVAENGQRIPCLKAFLATASPVFDRMLQSDCKETKEGACKLDISEEGVKALLNYIYCKSTNTPLATPSVALELLKSGEKYDISGLEASMKTIFLGKPVKWLTVDDALMLFIHSDKLEGYEELSRNAVQAIKLKKNDLQGSQVFDELVRRDPELTKKLFGLVM
ncbi:TD and POZ domain-containing protein 2 [Orchesella cincta]|uniref:TD and POZ domain-containing protein 2 n=1 Tax=Orchesella cincta TaxID=48709 RepID=A0A1D2ME56_ORCCI|nr:TD and POZ domain-containing protein 2 [Orchesella cincta]